MFSFLKQGDITNTIRTMTNLPGLFSSDGNKIKYSALNYATSMRENLHYGNPIFTNIRTLEAEIERRDIQSIVSGRLPSAAAEYAKTSVTMSPFATTDINIRRDNATLALIMAKELAFLNRTIQMISLIARRYQEEEEEAEWGNNSTHHDHDNDDHDDHDHHDHDEEAAVAVSHDFEDDSTSSVCPLERSSSASSSYNTHHIERRRENQLVATFLIASGRLQARFNNLCQLIEASTFLVNAMTTMDNPHNDENREKQLQAEKMVISNIYIYFEKFNAENRRAVVTAFLELRDISVSAWKIMSMFAFSNLFRLAKGTEYAIYTPDDAIFSQGCDYAIAKNEQAVAVWSFENKKKNDSEEENQEEPEAVPYD